MAPPRFLILSIVISAVTHSIAASVNLSTSSPMATFASERLEAALSGSSALKKVETKIDPSIGEQAYAIELSGNGHVLVSGGDERGLMYGLLDLEESVRLNRVESKLKKPKVRYRGLKFNIPLDARAPSYDDSGTSAIMNIEQVWERPFWQEFLDTMAVNRFNTLTLWCNHPFTSMLKLDDYPDVALDDVAVPTYEMDDQMLIQYRGEKLQDPQHFKIVKKMPIAEKIRHWQWVMKAAKERGIDIYFITWNIWIHGANGKYGLTDTQTNDKTIAYMRESMKQFVLTYPDLKGFGVTAGEHMDNKLEGEYEVEKWLWNTYGQGIVDAKAVTPEREFHFIHRIWYSGMDKMMTDFIDKYPDPIAVGFKYARARLYSIPNPSFFKNELQPKLEELGLSCWMNLRNDDIFNFRWGDPDYVREYIEHLPSEPLLAGFHMGSDGYVWGREFTSTEPDSPRQLEMDKHWYNFLLWGRLAYDTSLDRSFFEAKLAERFPGVAIPLLYETWQEASEIVPLINTYHWRNWDHMWSVETCMSKKQGYHSVNHFIQFGPLPDQGMVSIKDFVENPKAKGRGPLSIADDLDTLATQTLEGIGKLRNSSENSGTEFRRTLGDMEAFAYLAQYYADKLRGSTYVHMYRTNGHKGDKKMAIQFLEQSIDHWTDYGKVAHSQYEVQLLARTSYTDWLGKLLDHAKEDIQIANDARHGEFPSSVLKPGHW